MLSLPRVCQDLTNTSWFAKDLNLHQKWEQPRSTACGSMSACSHHAPVHKDHWKSHCQMGWPLAASLKHWFYKKNTREVILQKRGLKCTSQQLYIFFFNNLYFFAGRYLVINIHQNFRMNIQLLLALSYLAGCDLVE